MKKIFPLFICFIALFSFSMVNGAQSEPNVKLDSIAIDAVSKLQQKILLSDKQTDQVKTILIKYISVKSNLESPAKLFSQIQPLLDQRQKIKFQIINNDWWTSIVKEITDKDPGK